MFMTNHYIYVYKNVKTINVYGLHDKTKKTLILI